MVTTGKLLIILLLSPISPISLSILIKSSKQIPPNILVSSNLSTHTAKFNLSYTCIFRTF